MAKIPFNVKFRPQIESGEYKVVTGDDRLVKIICWNKKVFGGRFEIVGLVPTSQGDTETVQLYCPDGTLIASNWNERFKLFIITPEPELSEFERAIAKYRPESDSQETIQRIAVELLELARKEFVKQGYVIEKKAFHDAVENISDKHLAEMSVQYSIHCKVENGTRHAIMNWEAFQKVAQEFINIGRDEALKDLPRWITNFCKEAPEFHISWRKGVPFICVNDKIIPFEDLKKLPGFNE